MTAVHHLHGAAIATALPLSREPSGGEAELSVELAPHGVVPADPPAGELLAALHLDGQPLYSATATGDGYRLRVHGLCDFELEAGLDLARCRPDPSADAGTVALVTRGAFLAFWLGLRGACVLHASAVEWAGRAVVVAGHSGTGKSTVAAWACRAGARFVCDDLFRLGGGAEATWVGCSPELRLRPGAWELASGMEQAWGSVASVDGRMALAPARPEADEGPVAAVVLPRPDRETPSLSLERLDPVEAVLALAAFPRLAWQAGPGVEAQFDGVSRLAAAVPVYVATIPWGPPFRPGSAEELLDAVTAPAPRAGASS